MTAGAFSFGFLVSAVLSPCSAGSWTATARASVIEIGVVLMARGLLLAHVGHAAVASLCYPGHAGRRRQQLPRLHRAVAIPAQLVRAPARAGASSIAFSGVGLGSVILLPWLQGLIDEAGWRTACFALGIAGARACWRRSTCCCSGGPRTSAWNPMATAARRRRPARPSNIVDPDWAAIDWTLAAALRTARFWWIALAYFGALFAWYAVQVHQTKYLIEIGFGAGEAAWALGLVSLVAVPGADRARPPLRPHRARMGVDDRHLGFVACCAELIVLQHRPTVPLLYLMIVTQGTLGYGLTSVMGAIPAEIFAGKHFGGIFGTRHVVGDPRRRGRAVDRRRVARHDRELHAGLLDFARRRGRVGGGDLARLAGQDPRRRRPGSPRRRPGRCVAAIASGFASYYT